ncbi:MAG: hypothetical protein VX709_16145 [Pseudomonadota bacterium]|nr:hypothetical protein [Pseudomonadota bacterium]
MEFKSKQEKVIILNRAFWFQFEAVTQQKELVQCIASDLIQDVYQIAPKKRHHRTDELETFCLLLLNIRLAMEYGDGWIAIHSNKNRYSNTLVSYRHVHYLLEALLEIGWLERTNSFYNDKEMLSGLVARYKVREFLENQLNSVGLEHQQISFSPPNFGVVLKNSSKNIITIPESLRETAEVISSRLRLINEQYSKVEIGLSITELEAIQLAKELRNNNAIDSSNPCYVLTKKKYLKRTFNRSSFDLGGRFYGAWWQHVPTQWRRHITIDDRSTIELDYSAFHIRMLYGLKHPGFKGLDDPYDIGGIDAFFRPVTKQIFLIIINAKDRSTALNTIKRNSLIAQLREGKHPKGIRNFSEYLKRIEEQHIFISDDFYSDKGIYLQNIDSHIAEGVVLRMLKEHGAICLPVHDSFIVLQKHEEALRKVMEEEFNKRISIACVIKRNKYKEKIKVASYRKRS